MGEGVKKRVGFWSGHLGERGTDVSMYDYAYYNEKILGNESFIFYPVDSPWNNEAVIEKFKRSFQVYCVESFSEIDKHLLDNGIDYFYNQNTGLADGALSKVAKNCIHCVFTAHEPHGDVYTTISPWIDGNDGKYSTVPYMVSLPEVDTNLRSELNIPQNANVFGGYGGHDRFNIRIARAAVRYVAMHNPNIFFLFANFDRFCEPLPNIIHLPCIVDMDRKVEFINTCDAMIWARSDGETFGMAIAEFSSKNKPVIATKDVYDIAHVHLLGEKAIWYNNKNHLVNIFRNFDRDWRRSQEDWNAYREYTPEKVMKIFDEVFLGEGGI